MKEINALYNGKNEFIRYSPGYGDVHAEAIEIAKKEGAALIVHIKDKGSDFKFTTSKYNLEKPFDPQTEIFSIPKSLIKLIIDEYKNK